MSDIEKAKKRHGWDRTSLAKVYEYGFEAGAEWQRETQTAHDLAVYGTAMQKVYSDGTQERIDPLSFNIQDSEAGSKE